MIAKQKRPPGIWKIEIEGMPIHCERIDLSVPPIEIEYESGFHNFQLYYGFMIS